MANHRQLALKVVSGPDVGRVFALAEVSFIGCHAPCDVLLADPSVALMHARVGARGEVYTLTDLTDTPRVKVNGRVIKSRKLALGDRVNIAETAFEVVDAAAAQTEKSAPGPLDGVILVSAEEDPAIGVTADLEKLSKVVLTSEKADRARENPAEAQIIYPAPAPRAPLPEPVQRELRVAGDELDRYRYKAVLEAGKPPGRGRAIRYAAAAVFLLVIGSLTGFLVLRALSQRRDLEEQCRAIGEYAEAHSDDLNAIIEQYQRVRGQALAKHPRLELMIAERIREIEQARDRKSMEFEQILRTLDARALELAGAGSCEEALKVYQVDNPKLRDQIAAAKKGVLAELRRQAEAKRRTDEKQKKDEIEAARRKEIEERLRRAVEDVADALLAGRYDEATRLLDTLAADKDLASVRDKAVAALTEVKLLQATDARIAAAKKEKDPPGKPVAPDKDTVNLVESLGPVLKGVYAIRKDDLLVAQEYLRYAEGHLLRDVLLTHAKLTEVELLSERDAIRQCGMIWRKIVKKEVSKIPVPADCVAQLKKLAEDPKRKDIPALCGELAHCGERHRSTRFAQKYAELFAAAKGLRPGGLGDGKIIQADGGKYYVELSAAMADPAGKSVGLFQEKMVFLSRAGADLLAARVTVTAVLPFQAISEKQIVFSIPDADAEIKPAMGDVVLARKDLTPGARIIAAAGVLEPEVIFEDDFSGRLNPAWKIVHGGGRIEDGRLLVEVPGQRHEARRHDLLLDLPFAEPLRVSMDLASSADQGVTIVLGDVEFLLGGDRTQKEGIYVGGTPARGASFGKAGVARGARRVVLTRARSFARMEISPTSGINQVSADATLPPRAGDSIKGIGFFIDGKIHLDNVKVERPRTTGIAEIAALSGDRREALVSRGSEPAWASVKVGSDVYFLSKEDSATPPEPVVGRVGDILDPWLVCAIPDGKTLGNDLVISLTPQASLPTEKPGADEPGGVESAPPLLSGVVRNTTSRGVLVALDGAGPCPAKGCLVAVRDRVSHPKTDEILAFWTGKSVPAEFAAAGGGTICRLAAGEEFPSGANQSVLVSLQPLPPNRKVEVEGKSFRESRTGRIVKSKIMDVVSGKWKEQQGRFVSVPGAPEDVPVMATTETFSGNAQFDCELTIEKTGSPPEEDWVRDLLVEIYCPARRTALTFGIGNGRDKNVVVTGQTLNFAKGEKVLKKQPGLPATVKPKLDVNCAKGASLIKMNREYNVRARRAGDVVALYLNGKRAARVAHPDIHGDVQFRLAAPEDVISLGNISARELPASCRIPDDEPPLGEFGYVVWLDDSQILIDADMNGAAVGKKVTILAVEKVVQGEASRSVLTKAVAEAVIQEVGARTCRAVRAGIGEPIEKGMKVFVGDLPGAPVFGDARLGDLNLGL
ncbi:MAG: FHA domain-containing protein [Verrucomicrobiota bacterium]|nr:FHA domain-containing protein [Verrucomicrobiota bacterium]